MDNNEINKIILTHIKSNLGGKIQNIEETAGSLWVTCNDGKVYSIMVAECMEDDDENDVEVIENTPSSDHMWNSMTFKQIEKLTGIHVSMLSTEETEAALAKAKIIWDSMDYDMKYKLYLIS